MFVQLWPPTDDDADLGVGPHVFTLPMGSVDRGTYGYSLAAPTVAAEAATITITRIIHPRPRVTDRLPMPVVGDLENPGSGTLNSSAAFGLVAYQALRFDIFVFEKLPGFRLYADVRKRSTLR